MIVAALAIAFEDLAVFCQRWRIRELALFGSALRDDFRADSDIDLLVAFEDNAAWSLLAHIQMQQELEELLHRPVDLISRHALEESPNWIRRHEILNTAQVLYASHREYNGS